MYSCVYVHVDRGSIMHISSITEVWLGEYQGGKVAIKMLKDLRDAKASQLFLREASVMT